MKNGFTLVEVTIIIAILGILLSIAYPQYKKYTDPTWNPTQHQRLEHKDKPSFECIGGYKFIIDKEGNPKQIIGSNGNGVECFN